MQQAFKRAPQDGAQDIEAAIAQHGQTLSRRALWLTRNASQAADLYQETWDRALRRARHRRETQVTLRWLLTIMHNIFLDDRRAEAVRRTVPHSSAVLEQLAWPQPEIALWRTIDDELLRACMDRLSPGARQVIAMQLAGVPYNEIAARMGVQVNAVASRLLRARRHLRNLLHAAGIGGS